MWAERLGLWLMGLPAILAVRQDSTSRHLFSGLFVTNIETGSGSGSRRAKMTQKYRKKI
jgi:hypothetical protein